LKHQLQEGPKVVSEPAQTELAWDAQRHTCFRRGSAGGCYHKRSSHAASTPKLCYI